MEEYSILVDLGTLGTCILEDIKPTETEEGFTIVMSGYSTEQIQVYGVVDNKTWRAYPCIWNNSILIQLKGA